MRKLTQRVARHEITPPRFHGPWARGRGRPRPDRPLGGARDAPGLPHAKHRRSRPRLLAPRRRREDLPPGRLRGLALPVGHLPVQPLPHLARGRDALHPVRRRAEGQGRRRRGHQPEQPRGPEGRGARLREVQRQLRRDEALREGARLQLPLPLRRRDAGDGEGVRVPLHPAPLHLRPGPQAALQGPLRRLGAARPRLRPLARRRGRHGGAPRRQARPGRGHPAHGLLHQVDDQAERGRRGQRGLEEPAGLPRPGRRRRRRRARGKPDQGAFASSTCGPPGASRASRSSPASCSSRAGSRPATST